MSPRIRFLIDGQSRLLECDGARGTLSFAADGGEGELTVTLSSKQLRALDEGKRPTAPFEIRPTGNGGKRADQLESLIRLCLGEQDSIDDAPALGSLGALGREASAEFQPRAAGAAVTIFLFFGLFWLALAAGGLSGLPLAQGATVTLLTRGALALLAAILLAARLSVAPTAAAVVFVLIWICPSALSGLEQALETRAQTRQVDESLVARLSVPPWQRPVGPDPTVILQRAGYIEAPAVGQLVRVRRDNLEAWLGTHANTVYNIRADLYNRFHQDLLQPEKTPTAIFNQRLLVDIDQQQGGPDWVWFDSFMAQARQQGLDDPPRMTADEIQASQAYVRQWLSSHPDGAKQFSMAMSGTPVQSEGVDEVRHGGGNFIAFFLLAGVAAAWLGRASCRRPFDIKRIPGWTLTSLRSHIRQDRTAPLRLVAGLVCSGGGILLMAFLMAFHRLSYARMGFRLISLGVILIFTALIIPTDTEVSEGVRTEA